MLISDLPVCLPERKLVRKTTGYKQQKLKPRYRATHLVFAARACSRRPLTRNRLLTNFSDEAKIGFAAVGGETRAASFGDHRVHLRVEVDHWLPGGMGDGAAAAGTAWQADPHLAGTPLVPETVNADGIRRHSGEH